MIIFGQFFEGFVIFFSTAVRTADKVLGTLQRICRQERRGLLLLRRVMRPGGRGVRRVRLVGKRVLLVLVCLRAVLPGTLLRLAQLLLLVWMVLALVPYLSGGQQQCLPKLSYRFAPFLLSLLTQFCVFEDFLVLPYPDFITTGSVQSVLPGIRDCTES